MSLCQNGFLSDVNFVSVRMNITFGNGALAVAT